MLALQARPNAYPHSEVDFATFKWSASGVTLLGELGYGTFATATNLWDLRRYVGVDNNPAGHNTVVIHEARDAFFPTKFRTFNFAHSLSLIRVLVPQLLLFFCSHTLADRATALGGRRCDLPLRAPPLGAG